MTNQPYYETMYILRPTIPEDEVDSHLKKYTEILESAGGEVLDSQMRGKRRLAYPIGKHKEGIYVQLSHQGDGQHIAVLEKAMRLTEDVIRYLTVKQDGPLPAKRVVKTSEKNVKEDKEVENKETTTEDKDQKGDLKETKKSENKDSVTEAEGQKDIKEAKEIENKEIEKKED
ncbi:30S ribosomal protein S6 [Prochlorococcus marinus]|uniref:Small ribosomal subunit protein bS6 n=1 Tax=Prochlorococcus marinus (strain MIT 9211) TaxID=93059 RepID=RS6_PROM4|nr:30S ribosomal protein S6 [Prochlorococcus marinus]A9BDR2.1 RecName: Full=Small ribosomal subunit protein bS6; AltName: Full=30S ribosomal protein S6 [Prochlorococcus marinus str. MIT 9211]ABX09774.1 30S ribosomal protein S6 [Prochlorococcus marinus str. MIT 9211]